MILQSYAVRVYRLRGCPPLGLPPSWLGRSDRPGYSADGPRPARRTRRSDRDPGGGRGRAVPRARPRAPTLAVDRPAGRAWRVRASRGTSCSGCRSRAGHRLGRADLLPGDGGHTPIHGIDPDPAPLSHAPGIVIAALGTLGFGLVLGPEAPVVAIGSIVGVAVTFFARLAAKEAKVLATAGAFAAISALFGGPIVAGVMLTEAAAPTLGAALVPALLPGFVAAATGYVIFVGFGNWEWAEHGGPRRAESPLLRGHAHPRPLLRRRRRGGHRPCDRRRDAVRHRGDRRAG